MHVSVACALTKDAVAAHQYSLFVFNFSKDPAKYARQVLSLPQTPITTTGSNKWALNKFNDHKKKLTVFRQRNNRCTIS